MRYERTDKGKKKWNEKKKQNNLFMIFFGLPAFWAPECRAEEVWTPGKRQKKRLGSDGVKESMVVTCEWAAFAILVMV